MRAWYCTNCGRITATGMRRRPQRCATCKGFLEEITAAKRPELAGEIAGAEQRAQKRFDDRARKRRRLNDPAYRERQRRLQQEHRQRARERRRAEEAQKIRDRVIGDEADAERAARPKVRRRPRPGGDDG